MSSGNEEAESPRVEATDQRYIVYKGVSLVEEGNPTVGVVLSVASDLEEMCTSRFVELFNDQQCIKTLFR